MKNLAHLLILSGALTAITAESVVEVVLRNGYAFSYDLPLRDFTHSVNKTRLVFEVQPIFITSVDLQNKSLHFEGVAIGDKPGELSVLGINITTKHSTYDLMLDFKPEFSDPLIEGCTAVPAAEITFSQDLNFFDRKQYLQLLQAVSSEFGYPLEFIKVVSQKDDDPQDRRIFEPRVKLNLMAPNEECIQNVSGQLGKDSVLAVFQSVKDSIANHENKISLPNSNIILEISNLTVLVDYEKKIEDGSDKVLLSSTEKTSTSTESDINLALVDDKAEQVQVTSQPHETSRRPRIEPENELEPLKNSHDTDPEAESNSIPEVITDQRDVQFSTTSTSSASPPSSSPSTTFSPTTVPTVKLETTSEMTFTSKKVENEITEQPRKEEEEGEEDDGTQDQEKPQSHTPQTLSTERNLPTLVNSMESEEEEEEEEEITSSSKTTMTITEQFDFDENDSEEARGEGGNRFEANRESEEPSSAVVPFTIVISMLLIAAVVGFVAIRKVTKPTYIYTFSNPERDHADMMEVVTDNMHSPPLPTTPPPVELIVDPNATYLDESDLHDIGRNDLNETDFNTR